MHHHFITTMSFLAGRLAATEGAFFSQTSKQALVHLKDKLADATSSTPPLTLPSSSPELHADVLPEILQHTPLACPPSSSPSAFSPPPSSLAASLASAPPSSPAKPPSSQSILALADNPLAFFASVPQTSFGPKRWKPEADEVKILASTANEARMERSPSIDPSRTQDAVEAYFFVLKAFAAATTLLVGGVTILAGVACSRLEINSVDDIRTKGLKYMQSPTEAIRQQFEPWKQWAEYFDNHTRRKKSAELGTWIPVSTKLLLPIMRVKARPHTFQQRREVKKIDG